tara:strand:- start:6069 stop:6947 length:879 start_codon:yes stop_codon:yes gene_type:complete
MSNTTSIGDRAICEELSAVQLGSVSKPVERAYINNIFPVPAADLQGVCDNGFTTTTAVIASALIANGAGGVEASNGDIVASIGEILAGDKITAGTTLVAGTGITSTAGDITAATGDIVATTGKITSGANMDCGTTLAVGTGIKCGLNNIEAVDGDFVGEEGTIFIQRQILTNLADGGTTQLAPQLPPFLTTPSMKGKTKGAFWIQNPLSTITQFIVDTAIKDVIINATVHITLNQYNTANPRRMVSYRIGQVGLAPPDYTKLVISFTTDLPISATDPVRIGIMIYPDKDPNP